MGRALGRFPRSGRPRFESGQAHAPATHDHGRMEEGGGMTTDTLPAWLYRRVTASSVGWDDLPDSERAYWEHQADTVRWGTGFSEDGRDARHAGAPGR